MDDNKKQVQVTVAHYDHFYSKLDDGVLFRLTVPSIYIKMVPVEDSEFWIMPATWEEHKNYFSDDGSHELYYKMGGVDYDEG